MTGIWNVKGKLFGKPKNGGSDHKKSEDVSGIACAVAPNFPWTCLVVDDEAHGAQIVMLEDGRLIAGKFIPLLHRFHDGNLLELDGEGVAYSDGYFYVIGSYGRPRHEDELEARDKIKARAEATRHVFRIGIPPGAVNGSGEVAGDIEIEAGAQLSDFIMRQPELAGAMHEPLEQNGLTIEGVAVRDGRFYAGFRAPLIAGNRAAILALPVAALFDGAEADPWLFRLDLEGRGIRDLAAFEKGLLVLAGPVQDPPDDTIAPGDYRVYWWDGHDDAKLLCALASFGDKIKPEAIQPIGHRDGKLRVLILFDGAKEGGPRLVEIDEP